MAKKSKPHKPVSSAAAQPRQDAHPSGAALQPGSPAGAWVFAILCFMMFLTPAIGVPHEQLLQDTLKSIVVSFCALGAMLVFLLQQRKRPSLQWHALMWFPITLMLYALGSMVWSHAYLAGVEAVRWFVFGLLLWIGMNTLTSERLPAFAWAVHAGAVVASMWTALQFCVDFSYFAQGAHPASTFVNRNFFAEYAVCALPFSVWLLARARSGKETLALAITLGLTIVALMMTGTRSALAAMWLLLFLVFPVVGFLYSRQLAFSTWSAVKRIAVISVLLLTVVGLGSIETGNAQLNASAKGQTALERAFLRTASVMEDDEFRIGSFSVRLNMWKATGRMIQQNPVLGLGAGAWEVFEPLYQTDGSQLETEYYAHNELLQLLAEYGLLGWLALVGLVGYLSSAAWRTLKGTGDLAMAEAPIRAMALSSLLALMVVSNAGFPWRLAGTGAIFALCLAILAASDARLLRQGWGAARTLTWRPAYSRQMALATGLLTALAAYIAHQAVEAEQKLVYAVQIALSISESKDPNNSRWAPAKAQMLTSLGQGISINPHYRKLTPMVADELAKWGDWKTAARVWETVVPSRPYVVAILSNIARAHVQTGDMAKAIEFLERCKQIQPRAPAVRSLEIILLSRTGQEGEAIRLTRQSLDDNSFDRDTVNGAWVLGHRNRDYDLAIRGMEMRNKKWPAERVDGLLKLGQLYAEHKKDSDKALSAYREAFEAAPEADKAAVRQKIPPAFLNRL